MSDHIIREVVSHLKARIDRLEAELLAQSRVHTCQVYTCEVCSAPCYGVVLMSESCGDTFKPMGCLGGSAVLKPVWTPVAKRIVDDKV